MIPAVMLFCWWMYYLLFDRPKTDIRVAQTRATKMRAMRLPATHASNIPENITIRISHQDIGGKRGHAEYGGGTSDEGDRSRRSRWVASSSEPFGARGSTEGNDGPEVALIVRDGPLEMILSGRKTWEMRKTHTRKRGRIALVKKGTGKIYGVADIIGSHGPLSDETMTRTSHLHGIELGRLQDPQVSQYRFAWVLANVRRLEQPVPYEHPKGAQLFVRIDPKTSRDVQDQAEK